MRYLSTRGVAPELNFDDVLITGLARDGGLYLPTDWPKFSPEDLRSFASLSYPELAIEVMRPFLGDTMSREVFGNLVDATYRKFSHPSVAPIKQLESNIWLMELFHGPTLAFKDYAMQILGRLFDQALLARGKRTTIVGATSGDTGSAAIEACKDREAIDVFIFFPKDRVSPIQQKQMTTVDADNIHAIALEGTFDDCQDMVKALFNDLEFRDKFALSAVNSINWARLMPQIVYYFWAGLSLGVDDHRLVFSVPSGNFGNVFSAYAAKKMGLPIEKLIVATNSNDILSRFFNTGTMEIKGVQPSISPSMDIQVSSNFERLLFDLIGRDGASTNRVLKEFRNEGKFTVSEETLMDARRTFDAVCVDDMDTLGRISKTFKEKGEILDPHSAIGVEGAYRFASGDAMKNDISIVSLACAHPAKFPDAVQKATGEHPNLPHHLDDLWERKERLTVLPNKFEEVSNYIADNSRVELK